MNNRIHEIMKLKVLSDIDSQNNEDFYWNTNKYQSAIHENKNLLTHIARRLELKLNSEHRKSISYTVDSKLEGKEKELGICIQMHYTDNSDLNIRLLITESELLVARIINSIKFISETDGIDVNNVKIEEQGNPSNNIENGVIIVERGIKNTIYDILDDLKSNSEVTCEIGKETIKMILPKTNVETFESDDVESIIGKITAVIQSDTVSHVISENKKEEKYSYSKELKKELILHQLNETVLQLNLKKIYKNSHGHKKHVGGTIINIEEYTKNQQLDLSDL